MGIIRNIIKGIIRNFLKFDFCILLDSKTSNCLKFALKFSILNMLLILMNCYMRSLYNTDVARMAAQKKIISYF